MKKDDFADISVSRILHFVQSVQVTAMTSLLVDYSVLFYSILPALLSYGSS
jgi:hypothetical protein